jgi:putative nucleotidyltransferase with HDIG domain
MQINLQRTLISLTSALDFVGVDELHHGRRVALMAAAIAETLGWPAARRDDLLYAGMIHDCGVSRAQEHRQLTETLEWEDAEAHCLRGETYLRACPPLARYAPVIRWHHTRWEDLPGSLDTRTREDANLIFLADRVDVLVADYFTGGVLKNAILWEAPEVIERIAGLAGTLFSPELSAAFRQCAAREAFWLALDPAYIEDEIDARLAEHPAALLGNADALAIARLFAQTVDAKSAHTLEHSTRVARIARHLAGASGFDAETQDLMEIAGLLHDIGKLRVPEEIIDKPGPLTREERAFVQRHSYDTGQILKRVFPGAPIAKWAAMHHENLLGTGYPSHVAPHDIPPEARIVAVADIFQALCQNRPYRGDLAKTEVMAMIDRFCQEGRIDDKVVALLRREVDRCYALAVE